MWVENLWQQCTVLACGSKFVAHFPKDSIWWQVSAVGQWLTTHVYSSMHNNAARQATHTRTASKHLPVNPQSHTQLG